MHGYATSANSKFAKDKRMLWMWRGSLWGGGSVGLEEFLNFVTVNSFLKLFVLDFNCVVFRGNTLSGSLLRSQKLYLIGFGGGLGPLFMMI